MRFKEKALEVAEMLERKSEEYDAPYDSDNEFLKIMYPDGVPPNQYSNMVLCLRLYDTLKKLTKTGDTKYIEYIAGYGILAMCEEGSD
jgi:hypothetical protein